MRWPKWFSKGKYTICDDYGIWVVSSCENGPFQTQDEAQELCNQWNHEEGMALENGELKDTVTDMDEWQWRQVHLHRRNCTCPKVLYENALSQTSQKLLREEELYKTALHLLEMAKAIEKAVLDLKGELHETIVSSSSQEDIGGNQAALGEAEGEDNGDSPAH